EAPGASRKCPAAGHDSLAGIVPAGDRGSARYARQPGVLPARTPQTRTGRAGRVAAESFATNSQCAPLARMMESQAHACGVDNTACPLPFPKTRLRRG